MRSRRPQVGETVVYFADGTLDPDKIASGKVISIREGSGWIIDIEIEWREGRKLFGLMVACGYAPVPSVIAGRRPPGSWDFIA